MDTGRSRVCPLYPGSVSQRVSPAHPSCSRRQTRFLLVGRTLLWVQTACLLSAYWWTSGVSPPLGCWGGAAVNPGGSSVSPRWQEGVRRLLLWVGGLQSGTQEAEPRTRPGSPPQAAHPGRADVQPRSIARPSVFTPQRTFWKEDAMLSALLPRTCGRPVAASRNPGALVMRSS